MPKVADLHVHTHLSDSTFSPEKVVEYARAMGLDAIAITDHDCCDGITPAIIAAEDLGLEIIPGVELTAELEDREIHVLGYFIDWQDDDFLAKLAEIVEVRKECAKKILEKLEGEAVRISEEELFELSGPGCIGRLHIAQLLLKKGFVRSIQEAFSKYIGNDKPCYVKKFKLSPKEAMDLIKSVGGKAVLAHPKLTYVEDRSLEDIIKDLIKDGMDGIEVYHSDHSSGDVKEFTALAEKYNLLMTGGSDCHGLGKKEVLLGRVKVPYELVEKLRHKK